MTITDWVQQHWPELTAALGLGSSSGILSKKIVDREQNKVLRKHTERIDKLEEKNGVMDNEITTIKADLKNNTLFDKQLRQDLKEHRETLDRRLNKLEEGQTQLLNHIITLTSKK